MHYKIKNDLYLVQQNAAAAPTVQAFNHHLWLVDRSGSMYGLLPKLIDNLKEQVDSVADGDLVSFGYFSSEGTYAFPIKGFEVIDPTRETLKKLLDQHKTTLGMTCFSEILNECSTVINELDCLTKNFVLWLFTDGYPVVSNYSHEVKNIEAALKKLNSHLVSAQLIGYGDYYNKSLMADMAMWAGGMLSHSSSLPVVRQLMKGFIAEIPSTSKQKIQLPVVPSLVFSLDGSVYSNAIDVLTSSDKVFYLTDVAIGPQASLTDEVENALYLASSLLSQQCKTDLALEILYALGDVHHIKKLSNAFTLEELGTAEQRLVDTAKGQFPKYFEGRNPHIQPDTEAFCVLELLELLLADDEAEFYPIDPDFRYKSIGRKSTPKEGYPKFTANGEGCKFANLSWNKSRLNLSALVRINGSVDLGEEAENYGLPNTFHTYIWRNYTIIKDGALWTTALPVSVGEDTWSVLYEEGLVAGKYNKDSIYLLDLSLLPLINKSIANSAIDEMSATAIAKLAIEEVELGAALKVYKSLLVDYDVPQLKHYTLDQEEFLTSRGITKNGFAPPTEQEPSTDHYFAPGLEVKVAGYSSLPKLADVTKKAGEGKKLNAPSQKMLEALTLYNTAMHYVEDEQKRIQWLEEVVSNIRATQLKNRAAIQRAKFSILLGKRWFPEFTSRTDCELDVNGTKVSFVLSEEKVAI